jgi:hypothetical protein
MDLVVYHEAKRGREQAKPRAKADDGQRVSNIGCMRVASFTNPEARWPDQATGASSRIVEAPSVILSCVSPCSLFPTRAWVKQTDYDAVSHCIPSTPQRSLVRC